MDSFKTTMERWHDFYVAAGAAAVVLGLLFVSLSMYLNREASEYEMLYLRPHDLEFVHAGAPDRQLEAQW